MNELWYKYLTMLGYVGTVPRMLFDALSDRASGGTLDELWRGFLTQEVGDVGSNQELLKKHLEAKGYAGTVDEMTRLSLLAEDFFEEPVPPIIVSDLEGAIQTAEELFEPEWTDESYAVVVDALDAGRLVLANPQSQDEVDAAAGALFAAMGALEFGGMLWQTATSGSVSSDFTFGVADGTVKAEADGTVWWFEAGETVRMYRPSNSFPFGTYLKVSGPLRSAQTTTPTSGFSVLQLGKRVLPGNLSKFLYKATRLEEFSVGYFVPREPITNTKEMFSDSTAVTKIDMTGMDTSAVTDCSFMYEDCRALTTLIGGTYFPAAVRADRMFSDCWAIKSVHLESVAAGANKAYMFNGCRELESVTTDSGELEGRYMNHLFQGCPKLTSVPKIIVTRIVASTLQAFMNGCSSMASFPDLESPAQVSVSLIDGFFQCVSLTSIPEGFRLTGTNSSRAFYGCSSVDDVDVVVPNDATLDSTFANMGTLSKFSLSFEGSVRQCVSTLTGTTISTEDYSELLVALAAAPSTTAGSKVLGGGTNTYNDVGEIARNDLIDRGWTIIDGGKEVAEGEGDGSA